MAGYTILVPCQLWTGSHEGQELSSFALARDWHDQLTAVIVPAVIKRGVSCVEGRRVTLKALVGMGYSLKALACFEGEQAYKQKGSAAVNCHV